MPLDTTTTRVASVGSVHLVLDIATAREAQHALVEMSVFHKRADGARTIRQCYGRLNNPSQHPMLDSLPPDYVVRYLPRYRHGRDGEAGTVRRGQKVYVPARYTRDRPRHKM